jgi:hypothetical protein
MRKSYPVEFVAELRGIEPARSFTARDTGELVELAPVLQLEVANDDGSVELHMVRMSDRLTQQPATSELVRGSKMTVRGDAVISDEGKSWFSYMAVAAA